MNTAQTALSEKEVFIALDFLDDWTASLEKPPTLQERCARLIHYAIYDA
jgi:hypothetical protein